MLDNTKMMDIGSTTKDSSSMINVYSCEICGLMVKTSSVLYLKCYIEFMLDVQEQWKW